MVQLHAASQVSASRMERHRNSFASAPFPTQEASLGLLKQTRGRRPGCWKPGEITISLWLPVSLFCLYLICDGAI